MYSCLERGSCPPKIAQEDQRTDLSEVTDEELREAIRKKFQQMTANGIDVAAILREAGIEIAEQD